VAGNPVTRADLDNRLAQGALLVLAGLDSAQGLGAWAAGQSDAQITNLDPAHPYSTDEVYAIRLWITMLTALVTAADGGAAFSQTTPTLREHAAEFTGLAIPGG
jgi:hypothetical protein